MKKNQKGNFHLNYWHRIRYIIKAGLFSVSCLLFFSNHALSQVKNVTGIISNENHLPIEGVSVLEEGTSNGTLTDVKGEFKLAVKNAASNLVISYVGYKTIKVPVKGKINLEISLEPGVGSLEDVVVVGYGTQKKLTVTGAVSSINGAELVTTKNENIENMITGKLPGVRVVQRSSEPGEFDNVFDIRGLGNPLIVIDGVPRDNITRLDPNEIESISVLKDASAAIYGVRAANGVVLITTKKGDIGKVRLNYSFNQGIQQALGLPNPSDAFTQMVLKNEMTMDQFENPFLSYSDEEMKPYQTGEKKSSDWQGAALRKVAPISQHDLSVSGGSERLRYYFNFGYLKQGGFWKSNDLNYNKYNFRTNVDAQISKKLKTDLKVAAIIDQRNKPYQATDQVFKSLWRQSALMPVYANNNKEYPGEAFDAANTVVMTNSALSGYQKDNNKWFQSSLGLTYTPIEGLDIRGMYSYDYTNYMGKGFRKEYALYTYDNVSKTYDPNVAQSPSTIGRATSEKYNTLMQLSLNYKHTFGKHHLGGLLLYEEGNSSGDNFNASRELSIQIDQLFAGNVLNQVGTMDPNGEFKYASKSLVGRLNYDFDTRYLAELSFRDDGSSKFTKSKQWGFFPAVSVGWIISNENFMKNSSSLSFISNLKLRASYGQMGDDGALNYQFLSGYDYPVGGYMWDGNFVNGVGFRPVANPNISWITSSMVNLGLDASFWKDKLGVTFDVFKRDRNGLLAQRNSTLPGTVGIQFPQENLNSDRTYGFEIEVSHKNRVSKDFTYRVSASLSYTLSQDRFVELATFGNSYDNWRWNYSNRNKNLLFSQTVTGAFQSYSEIQNYNVNQGGGNKDLLPGDLKYEDWNGDGVIDDNDAHPIALTSIPLINGSVNFSATYKNYDLSFLFQGAGLSYVQLPSQLLDPDPWGDGNILQEFQDRWHTVDPKADRFDPTTKWISGKRPALGRPSGDNSTEGVKNANYIRLKTLEIGYSLPQKVLSKVGITNCRVYFNGYNLLTMTGVPYIDPEHPGDDYGLLYPLNRTFNFGFNVTF